MEGKHTGKWDKMENEFGRGTGGGVKTHRRGEFGSQRVKCLEEEGI